MRFVKFKENNWSVTAGKEYKIEFETEKRVCFVDEHNDIQSCDIDDCNLEIIDKPVMVEAYDDTSLGGSEVELIHDLGEAFEYRYVCKDKNGDIRGWQQIEYIEEPEKIEVKLNEIESLNKDINDLKGQVSDILRLLNEKI
jgi:hypothetical protein